MITFLFHDEAQGMSVVKRTEPDQGIEGLLTELRPRLRSVLARYRIPFEDAEDLLQQTLLSYLYKRKGIQKPDRWLLGTLRNRCLMYWRRRKRRLYHNVDAVILESLAAPRRPDQEIEDLRRDLCEVLAELPPHYRNVLRLRYGLGCNPLEAARQLGYSDSSIYKVLDRALAALTRRLVARGLVEPTHLDL